jgi:hypothetical protein
VASRDSGRLTDECAEDLPYCHPQPKEPPEVFRLYSPHFEVSERWPSLTCGMTPALDPQKQVPVIFEKGICLDLIGKR